MFKSKKIISIILVVLMLFSLSVVYISAVECSHSSVIRVDKKKPTCTEDGHQSYKLCRLNDCILNANNEVVDFSELIIPATGHQEITIEGKVPTCTEDGLSDGKKCTVCKEFTVEQVVLPSSGHNEIAEEIINGYPTCTVDGEKTVTVYCDICDAVFSVTTVKIPSTGEHNYTSDVSGSLIEPTCVDSGSVIRKCSCGEEKKFILEIDENNHSWGDWSVTVDSSCTTKGEEVRFCNHSSDHKETREIPINTSAHTLTSRIENEIAATCGKEGSYDLIIFCSACKTITNRENVIVPASGNHSYTTEVSGTRIPATCIKEGSVMMKCICGAQKSVALPVDADNHKWSVNGTVTLKATCVSEGKISYKCENIGCGAEKVETISVDINGHKWDNGTVIKNSTCSAQGVIEYVCIYNGIHKRTENLPIDSNKHNIITENRNYISATCGKNGSYDQVTFCADCKTVYNTVKVTVAATGEHNYSVEVGGTKVSPTCSSVGYVTRKCNCGAVKVFELPLDVNAHSWDNGTVTVKATCVDEGTVEYGCVYNALHKRTEKIPIDKNAHKEVTETRNYIDATCGKNGSYDIVTFCDDCKLVLKTVKETIPLTGNHNYINEVEGTKVSPTCISIGSVTKKCECGAKKSYELPIDPTAHHPDSEGYDCILCGKELKCRHNWTSSKVVTKESSCIENGSKAIICTKCNEPKSGTVETIPAYGHDFLNEWKTLSEATCQAQGIKIRVCRNCYDVETKTTAKLSHTDKNKDYICDVCNTVTDMSALKGEKTESTDSVPTPCSCNCHKTGISKILFTITNFFEKLFGNNKVCSCGVKH